jgi:diguanylate cyclase (GGDEF)-like protein
MPNTQDSKSEDSIVASADRELLDLLYRNAPISLFSSTAVAILLLSVLYESPIDQRVVVSWVIVLTLFNLTRLILRSIRESSLIKNRYSSAWPVLYAVASLAAGLMWASLVVIYQESMSLFEQLIVLASLVGLPIAAMPNNALKLSVYYAFCIPILIGLQYWAYFVSLDSNIEFSVLGLAYSSIVLLTGHIYRNSFRQALCVKYENRHLVEELSSANQRLEEFAYIDPLTGLTNRRWFREQADQTLERCHRHDKRLAILLIDLDNFKEVNDTLGHETGDEILIVVAKRLKSALRQSDTLTLSTEETARYGGDEFILLLEDFENIEDVVNAAERILLEVNEPIVLNEHSFNPGCSIGVSVFPDDAQSIANLIRQADVALYQAKQSGKGCARFFGPRPEAESEEA